MSTGIQQKQTAPQREGHRYAGPVAVVPLQHHTPRDRMKPSNPDLSQAASQSPPREYNARGPHHIRRWTPPRSCHLSLHTTDPFLKSLSGWWAKLSRLPGTPSKPQSRRRMSTSLSCFTHARNLHYHVSKLKKSLAPSSDDVPHRIVQPSWTTRRNPLPAKSSHDVEATSAILRRSPMPH